MHHQETTVHLENLMESTGDSYRTHSGKSLPRNEYIPVLIHRDTLIKLAQGKRLELSALATDIDGHNQRVREQKRRTEIEQAACREMMDSQQ